MQLIYQGSSVATNFWLNFWSSNKFGDSAESKYRDLYLGVYGALGFVQSIAVMILTISLSLTTLDASKVNYYTRCFFQDVNFQMMISRQHNHQEVSAKISKNTCKCFLAYPSQVA